MLKSKKNLLIISAPPFLPILPAFPALSALSALPAFPFLPAFPTLSAFPENFSLILSLYKRYKNNTGRANNNRTITEV